jgi:hypothetical protein
VGGPVVIPVQHRSEGTVPVEMRFCKKICPIDCGPSAKDHMGAQRDPSTLESGS